MREIMKEVERMPAYRCGLGYCKAVAAYLAHTDKETQEAATSTFLDSIVESIDPEDTERREGARSELPKYKLDTELGRLMLCFELLPCDVQEALGKQMHAGLVAFQVLHGDKSYTADDADTSAAGLFKKLSEDKMLMYDGLPFYDINLRGLLLPILSTIRKSEGHAPDAEYNPEEYQPFVALLAEIRAFIAKEAADACERLKRKLSMLEPLAERIGDGKEMPAMLDLSDAEGVGGILSQLLAHMAGSTPDTAADDVADDTAPPDVATEAPVEAATQPVEEVDELEARARIANAVLDTCVDDAEKAALWSMRPERLRVQSDDGPQSLLQSVMDECLTTAQIAEALQNDIVEYHETVGAVS